MLDNWR